MQNSKSAIVTNKKYIFVLSVIVTVLLAFPQGLFSAALNTISNTQSSLKVSTLSDHTFQFITPTGVGAGQNITITFPAQYSMGSFAVTNVDFAVSSGGSCSSFSQEPLAGSPSGATWGVGQSGQIITITSGTATIPANRCVQIKVGSNASNGGAGVSQITNPSSANFYVISLDTSSGDSGLVTESIITDDTVALSGTVSQSLTFSISATTLYFGTLSSGAVKFASSTDIAGATSEVIAHTLNVSTNAASGFVLTVQGQTLTSLQNTSNTISAIGGTEASSTPGNEQFGLRVTESGGSGVTVASKYGFATSYAYDATATTSSVIATGIGSTPTSVMSVRYLTNINPITEAGTYAANLVYIATANF